MNIVYIIGNGFDLNLGLKTSYRDFYEYYKKQPSKDELIAEKKKEMEEFGSDTWEDLEIALGKFTTKFKSVKDFQKVYFDISDKLREYIWLEERKLAISSEKKSKLCRDMISPRSHLRITDGEIVDDYYYLWQGAEWNINVINFNYSKTIESLLGLQADQADQKMVLEKNKYARNVYLSKIVHIHGVADKDTTLLLGVNDSSQIENEILRADVGLLDTIVKPQTNKGLGLGIDNNCIHLLQGANLICIFGSSIGDTDKMWWEILGERLIRKDRCRVIYFVRGDIIPGNRGHLLSGKISEYKDHILSKTNLSPQEKKVAEDKIWVGYNTGMFKVQLPHVDTLQKTGNGKRAKTTQAEDNLNSAKKFVDDINEAVKKVKESPMIKDLEQLRRNNANFNE
jgi:hypothetical protein